MSLRVLTINLYNGAADPAGLARALESLQPDIVAAQELSANAAEVLADWSSTAHLDPRDDTTGMGLAARFPMDTRRIAFPHRNPIIGLFDGSGWGLPEVELINTHLMNPIARPFAESLRLRRRELAALESILSTLPSDGARVVVGDFNSSPAWPLYRRLAKSATDGAVAAGTAQRTWSYFPSTPRLLRIDHVFLQGLIRCVGTRLVTLAGADHRGLLADLEPVGDQERAARHP